MDLFPRFVALPIAALSLCACAAQNGSEALFDTPRSEMPSSVSSINDTPTSRSVATGTTEKPRVLKAGDLLGSDVTGPGYKVAQSVVSGNRFNAYRVTSDYGNYQIIGDALMRKHLIELHALNSLKKKNKVLAVAEAGSSAIIAPVTGLANAVAHPVSASKQGFNNIKSGFKTAGKTASVAKTFLVTGGDIAPTVAEREKDGFFEKFLGQAEARRELALELMVDPHTHFVPLQNALDEVAGYKAAGQFGIERGIGFAVPGVSGLIVSGLKGLDSLTKKTLNLPPKKMADLNRERLKKAGFSEDLIEAFILAPQYTPSEKTILTGGLIKLSKITGVESLIKHATAQTRRASAFSVLVEISMIGKHIEEVGQPDRVAVIEGVPVLWFGGGKRTVIAAYDQLAWTRHNAGYFTKLHKSLELKDNRARKTLLLVSGKTTDLSRKRLKKPGWVILDETKKALETNKRLASSN